jgi:hypothetical protein
MSYSGPGASTLARASVLALVAAAAVPAGAQAANFYVATGGDDAAACTTEAAPCATIQAAVGKAAAGDQVFVGPGSFAGANVTKALRIRGAQAGVDARDRAVSAAEETTVTSQFTLGSPAGAGVTIDGFTIDIDGNLGVGLSTGNGHVIKNNVIRDGHHGISDLGSSTTWTAVHNRFIENNVGQANPSPAAIWAFGSGPNRIEDNLFERNRYQNTNTQAFDGADINMNGGSGKTVEGNRSIDGRIFVVSADATDVTIADNITTGQQGSGISLLRGNVDWDIVGNDLGSNGADSTAVIFGSTNFGAPESRGFTIVGNDFEGWRRGVSVAAGNANLPVYEGVLEVHYNRFANNAGSGLVNNLQTAQGSIDAENNWWGCNAGPNAVGCSTTTGTGTTDADPHVVFSFDASSSTILTGGDSALLHAAFTQNSAGAAIDEDQLPDIPVGFATDLGTLDAASVLAEFGEADNELTSGATAGTATVTATADGQPLTDTVAVTANAGPQGQQGQQGQPGSNGSNGSNGTNGGDGATGATGPQGSAGQAGPQGTPGAQGLPAPNTPADEEEPSTVSIAAATLRASSKGVVKVKVTCPAGVGSCEGTVQLKNGRKIVGRKTFRVGAGRSLNVPVKLTKSTLRSVRAGKIKKLTALVYSRDGDGDATESTRSLNIRR